MTDEVEKQEVEKSNNSLVFISHDTRDDKLAEAFSGLLKSVSAGVLKSFRASDRKGNQGIEYGVEWYPEIIKNIKNASDVVCLLTKRSVDRPWILFEAGMAKSKLETTILGVALGISLSDVSSGPFAQFQNCGDDEDSLTKLVFQLVDRIPNSEPDEDTIKFQVGKFKESIDRILKESNGKAQNTPATRPTNDDSPAKLFEEIKVMFKDFPSRDDSSAKLLEEIKVMFKDLPSRIEGNYHSVYTNRNRRKIHPMMIDEMMHLSENGKIGIVMALGLLRNITPWIYDMGMDTLRIIDSSVDSKTKLIAIREFDELLIISAQHPMMREMLNSKEDFMLLEKLPHILTRQMDRYFKTKIGNT